MNEEITREMKWLGLLTPPIGNIGLESQLVGGRPSILRLNSVGEPQPEDDRMSVKMNTSPKSSWPHTNVFSTFLTRQGYNLHRPQQRQIPSNVFPASRQKIKGAFNDDVNKDNIDFVGLLKRTNPKQICSKESTPFNMPSCMYKNNPRPINETGESYPKVAKMEACISSVPSCDKLKDIQVKMTKLNITPGFTDGTLSGPKAFKQTSNVHYSHENCDVNCSDSTGRKAKSQVSICEQFSAISNIGSNCNITHQEVHSMATAVDNKLLCDNLAKTLNSPTPCVPPSDEREMVVRINCQADGGAKIRLQFRNNIDTQTSPTEHQNQTPQQNKFKSNTDPGAIPLSSNKKKKKSRPSCKKRRRHQMQKDKCSTETPKRINTNNQNGSNGCGFSFMVGCWNSPSPSEDHTELAYRERKDSEGSTGSRSKFSLFISAADLSDEEEEESEDDGFSEDQDEDVAFDEGLWNSFVLNPFNLQVVCHLSPVSQCLSSSPPQSQGSRSPAVERQVIAANRQWNSLYGCVNSTGHSSQKVYFAKDLVTGLTECPDNIAEPRKGPWEEMARDRQRFSKRTRETEAVIGYCLQAKHRAKIWASFSGSDI